MNARPPARCRWVANAPELDIAYHDAEWGVPVRDDARLFECLILEGAQAGLSWSTILAKREHYRKAYRGFDPAVVARFTTRSVERMLGNAGLVRHRGKLEASIDTARAVLAIQEQHGSLAAFVWSFVEGRPLDGRRRRHADLPTETHESRALSKALEARGCRFVGPTTCYAFMQAVGMVNDHETRCFRHAQVAAVAATWTIPRA